jgi:tetratricopeptide (TPR) repeat protein
MSGSSTVALIAGLLFAAHPIHVEAVANIVGRAELMCALGMFVAMVLFLRPPSYGRACAIWGCFVLAMLSKEQGLLLPLALLIAAPLRERGTDDAAQRSRRVARADLLLLILMLWTLASYILFRERILKFWWERSFLDPTINPLIQSTGIDRWLLPIALFGRYVALLVFPWRLLPDYGGDVIGSHVHFNDPYLYLGIAAAVAFAVACLFAVVKKKRRALFCLLAFAILYGMIANVLTLIGTNFAERLMYIPSAFVCILAATALSKLPRPATIAITTIVLVLMSPRTFTYAARWNDPTTLFETALAQEPRSIRLYLLLAEDQQRRGDIPAARRTLERGRAVAPNYYRVWLNTARLELDAGDFDAAMRYATEGQRVQPSGVGQQLIGLISEAQAQRAATRPTTR